MFLDPSGRRWRRLRLVLAVVAVALMAGSAYALPRTMTDPEPVAGLQDSARVLHGHPRPPVLGEGPLVMVATASRGEGGTVLRDAVTGDRVAGLTGGEAEVAARAKVVLYRYGYPEGSDHLISLTFDDGPNPKYTRQLLDLLSRENVPSTFFVVGSGAARHADLVARESREGHEVANHSLTHLDLSVIRGWHSRMEMLWTERVLRATTGHHSALLRLPYEGDDVATTQEDAVGILRAQRLGYVVASHDFDSNDWAYGEGGKGGATIAMPELDGRNLTLLLHDAGGDRTATVAYVEQLIQAAKAKGYTFRTMSAAHRGHVPPVAEVSPDAWDRLVLVLARAMYDWPGRVLLLLLLLAGVSVAVSVLNCAVTLVRVVRRRGRSYPAVGEIDLAVCVVIAAYNEEKVIERTVRSVLASTYPVREVLVVDDGSTDRTLEIMARLAMTHRRVYLVNQANAGKAAALNRGIAEARGTVVVTMDADTVITPDTVYHLVRHFAADHDGRLGAVAGVVRVGNRRTNLLTRWQALEYVSQIGVERAAQDVMGAIAIVPGACAAWRKTAILEVGGYSTETLAEDCDLSLSLHQAGWRVTQDDEAHAYTEAPEDLDSLLAQRTRWMFGTLQAIHKHKNLLFGSRGWLSWFVLPMYVISIVVPILFLPLTTVSAVLLVRQQGWWALGAYLLVFLALQILVGVVAVFAMRERWTLLLVVPFYRVVFEPLRAYLLYTSTYMAIRGVRAGWNKLNRTGSVTSAGTGSLPIVGAASRPPGPAVIDLTDAPAAAPERVGR